MVHGIILPINYNFSLKLTLAFLTVSRASSTVFAKQVKCPGLRPIRGSAEWLKH
jgi:hypothetical protein